MKIILILILCFICSYAYADRYYVFMDKIGVVHKGQEAGHTAYGDVIAIHPFTPQYKPTKAELSRYKIIVTDLTDEERWELQEPVTKDGTPEGEITKARKRNVDIDKINAKQEENVAKSVIFDNTSVSLSL